MELYSIKLNFACPRRCQLRRHLVFVGGVAVLTCCLTSCDFFGGAKVDRALQDLEKAIATIDAQSTAWQSTLKDLEGSLRKISMIRCNIRSRTCYNVRRRLYSLTSSALSMEPGSVSRTRLEISCVYARRKRHNQSCPMSAVLCHRLLICEPRLIREVLLTCSDSIWMLSSQHRLRSSLSMMRMPQVPDRTFQNGCKCRVITISCEP